MPERFTLDRGRSGSFFVLSVSYVSQRCSVHEVFTYDAGSSIQRESVLTSMVPAALLACCKFLFYMHAHAL
jgi:hypothetical protein